MPSKSVTVQVAKRTPNLLSLWGEGGISRSMLRAAVAGLWCNTVRGARSGLGEGNRLWRKRLHDQWRRLRHDRLAHALFFVIYAMLLSMSGAARASDDFIISREFLEDKSATLTIADVVEHEFSPMGKILIKGYSDSVFWLRLKVEAPQQGNELVLRINPSFLDEIRLFEPDLSGPNRLGDWLTRVVGDRYPFDQRDWYSVMPSFVIHPAATENTIYLRMKTSSSAMLSVVALLPRVAKLQETRQFAVSGLYLGIMFWFLFWVVNDYLAIRDRLMGRFIIYQVSSIFYFFSRQGYLALCVPAAFPELADYLSSTVMCATVFCAILFHRTFIGFYAPSRLGLYGLSALMPIFPFQLVAIWSDHVQDAMHVNTLVLLLLAVYLPAWALTTRGEGRWALFAIYVLSGLSLLISAVPLLGWVEIKREWILHAALGYVLIADLIIFLLLWQRVKQRNIQHQQAELNKRLTEQQLNSERARREEQSRFMAMLSHELKTPLSVMRMSLGAQLDGQPPDKKRMRAEQALEEVNAIVERCLQVDKLEQRNTLVQLENCRLQKILEETRLVSAQPECVDMRIAALPMIKTDIQLLRVILTNLVDNALKYAAQESLVQVTAQVQHKDNVYGVCVAVENTPGSAGMPDPERVFSKYYRSPGAHRKTGSGLGLYLVHSMTALLGGEIVYRPGPDKVRFELWLPQGA